MKQKFLFFCLAFHPANPEPPEGESAPGKKKKKKIDELAARLFPDVVTLPKLTRGVNRLSARNVITSDFSCIQPGGVMSVRVNKA